MSSPILEIKNLYASYDNTMVLEDINLTLFEDDFLGIIGPNGGGKTTLIKCIIGLKRQKSGEIKFYKQGVEQNNLRIGYLPQYTSIDKTFPISVIEVILSGLSCTKNIRYKNSSEDLNKASQIIEKMGLTGLENRAIGELSGGQLQRAILGRSIIAEPDILILDEPSTYIDKKIEGKLYTILKELQPSCAIVLISHDIPTTVNQANNFLFVNKKASYCSASNISINWLEEKFECPISLLGFGNIPNKL